jgi:hypothetical protein
VALACLLSLSATGCLSPLAKRSAGLSSAVTPVIEQTTAAYRDARELHDLRVDYDAVAQFDSRDAVYNPRKIQPLLTDDDIQVRVAVLTAFQTYSQSLVAITNGTDSPELDSAAKSVGTKLGGLANSVAPSIQALLNTAKSVPATPEGSDRDAAVTPVITPQIQNGISTAANALAQFLVSNRIRKDLPGVIRTMDPHLQALCDLLEKDTDTLQAVGTRDYNFLINQQTLFIRSSQLEPQQRRDQIMKLPQIVRRERIADQKLSDLKASIKRLSAAHTSLLAAAQGNNSEILKEKLTDLEAAGNSLGTFYASLQSQSPAGDSH